MNRTLTQLATAGLALSLTGAFALQVVQERHLKDADLKKFTEALADYLEARTENSGVTDALGEVQSEHKAINEKKLKRAAIADLLASPADVGFAIWSAGPFAKARVKKGKVEEQIYETGFFSEDDPLEYAIWTPSKYSTKEAWPLIISVPDAGVDPKEHLIEKWEASEIRDNAILAAPKMPGNLAEWTANAGIGRVLVLITAVSDTHGVDFDRIYLAGRGEGVGAALTIASYFPDRFAGVIGRAGDAGDTPAANFRNLPTYFAGGGGKVTAFAEAIEAAGYGNTTVQADGLQPDIWSWIEAHPRASYPDKVTLVPGTPFPIRSSWVQVPPSDGATSVRVEASVDREKNTITIDATGTSDVTVYFSDALVDLNRPVIVIANGQKYTDQPPRRLNTVLDLLFKATIDPGKVFVASKEYYAPPRADEKSGE